jgi:hypothetical protein
MSRSAVALGILQFLKKPDHWPSRPGLMNGDEVAARMKRTKSFVPIILLSGCDNFSDSDFLFVDRVVRKGEGPTELMTTLHSLLLTSSSPIARWLRREEARNDTTKGAF